MLPPNDVYFYSEVGLTLAGYLVEAISGVLFAQYVDEHILKPLGMEHSSFQPPLPPQLMNNLAVGYRYEKGTYRQRPLAYINSTPAGALMATASDMAYFII